MSCEQCVASLIGCCAFVEVVPVSGFVIVEKFTVVIVVSGEIGVESFGILV